MSEARPVAAESTNTTNGSGSPVAVAAVTSASAATTHQAQSGPLGSDGPRIGSSVAHDDPFEDPFGDPVGDVAKHKSDNAPSGAGVAGYDLDDEPTASITQPLAAVSIAGGLSPEQQHEKKQEQPKERSISPVLAPSTATAVKESTAPSANDSSPFNDTQHYAPPSSPPPTTTTSVGPSTNTNNASIPLAIPVGSNAGANTSAGASSSGIAGYTIEDYTRRQPSRTGSQSNGNGNRPEKVQNSEWGLKEIIWPPEPWENQPQRRVKIITQNANGPCSFIAICNILILRGAITIQPPDRPSASYEYLSMLIGDYLVNSELEMDLSAVFSVLPKTQSGLDLNPLFTGISSFRPAGEGGELKLFDFAGIKLVHGWLADPSSLEFDALSKTEDYDNSLDVIVAADALTSGKFTEANLHPNVDIDLDLDGVNLHSSPNNAGGSSSAAFASGPNTGYASGAKPQKLTEDDHKKIQDAILIKEWFDSNPTQLTYYGLFALNDTEYIKPNELVCLFRGSHLSVLYKRLDPRTQTTMLWTLVTDKVFLRESSVIWESLVDVDGQSASFVDSFFVKSTPVGGDFAGQTSEQIARAYDRREEQEALSMDMRLAQQLQLEEDHYAREAYQQRHRQLAERRARGRGGRERDERNEVGYVEGDLANGLGPRMQGPGERAAIARRPKKKKSKDCIIM